MEKEKETVKIFTHADRIITLTISSKTATHLFGKDKFGDSVILPISDIKSMLPIYSPGKLRADIDPYRKSFGHDPSV